MAQDPRGFFEAVIGDGRPLITFTGLCLGLAGGFALFQAETGHFLPQDVAFLQMSSEDLCKINECRVVHFMIHDRVSFGGSLIALAALYLWIAEFPLRAREAWSWWALAVSGGVGFASFLTYLGYGYLDTWHGAATLVLLPCFSAGLWMTRGATSKTKCPIAWRTRAGLGRVCLLASAIGAIGAGFTIQTLGMTSVFVPSDLTFIGLSRAQFDAINPRLVPLIAHDRAGFGGGLASLAILVAAIAWFTPPSHSQCQTLLIAGLVAWGSAIGVHPAIGYLDALHLAPAVTGSLLYFVGLSLMWRSISGHAGPIAAPGPT